MRDLFRACLPLYVTFVVFSLAAVAVSALAQGGCIR